MKILRNIFPIILEYLLQNFMNLHNTKYMYTSRLQVINTHLVLKCTVYVLKLFSILKENSMNSKPRRYCNLLPSTHDDEGTPFKSVA